MPETACTERNERALALPCVPQVKEATSERDGGNRLPYALRTGDAAAALGNEKEEETDAVGWFGNAGHPGAGRPRRTGDSRARSRRMRRELEQHPRHDFRR